MSLVRINLLISLLSFILPELYGQRLSRADSVNFSGIIVNTQTGESLSGVNCRNTIGHGTASDDNGHFRLRIGRKDSIVFTHVGFKPFVVTLSDTFTDPEYIIGIFMSPDTLLLSEVLIIRRWKDNRQYMINARNNMSGLMKQAYAPVQNMDADMNQRMMLQEYARKVEMKGHVDVKVGVGTQSLNAFKLQKIRNRVGEQKEWLTPFEVDLLKKLYYSEKRKKSDI